MNILAIGDPHGILPKGLSRIVNDEKIDVIICVGDVPPVPEQKESAQAWKTFRAKADKSFERVVDKLCSYKLPVLILRGNMYLMKESTITTKRIFSKHPNLIYKKTGKVNIKGVNFILFDMTFEPHSHPRTFRTGSKRKKEQNNRREAKLLRLLKNLDSPVLVTHAPPYKILDKTTTGQHIGSKILLRAIKAYPPQLYLCGHVHEAKGKRNIFGTKIYNLGYQGDYEVLKI